MLPTKTNRCLPLFSLIFGSLSLISFVLMLIGLLSQILLLPNPGWIPMLFGVLAIVTGIAALAQIKKKEQAGKAMAICGLILGGLGLGLTVLYLWVLIPILMRMFEAVQIQLGFTLD